MPMGNVMISFAELSFWFQVRVAWGFLWRGIVITLCSMVVGGLAGGIAGFMLALFNNVLGLGLSQEAARSGAQILGGIAGGCVALVLWWFYIRWLFRATLAGYSLRLVPVSQHGI